MKTKRKTPVHAQKPPARFIARLRTKVTLKKREARRPRRKGEEKRRIPEDSPGKAPLPIN